MLGLRWGYCFTGSRPAADDIQRAIAAYSHRFGRPPAVMVLNAGHLVEGIQAPLGLTVEGDRHVSRSIIEFDLPQAEAPAPPLFPAVFPVAFLAIAQSGAPLPLNGLSLWGFIFIGLAVAIALAQLIRAIKGGPPPMG